MVKNGIVINLEVARLGRDLHDACERGRYGELQEVLRCAEDWFGLHSQTREEAAFWAGALRACLRRCANDTVYELVENALEEWKQQNRIAGGV